MTKEEAVAEWIEQVYAGNTNAVITSDADGKYYVNKDHYAINIVYSYGGYTNSSANLEVDDIIKRF